MQNTLERAMQGRSFIENEDGYRDCIVREKKKTELKPYGNINHTPRKSFAI